MEDMQYISIEDFGNIFRKALIRCNITPDVCDRFLSRHSRVTLARIGVCAAISTIIDDYVREELPDYDGSLSTETFDVIYDWNKVIMYERAKERERGENVESAS